MPVRINNAVVGVGFRRFESSEVGPSVNVSLCFCHCFSHLDKKNYVMLC